MKGRVCPPVGVSSPCAAYWRSILPGAPVETKLDSVDHNGAL